MKPHKILDWLITIVFLLALLILALSGGLGWMFA
jgi:hypothetical protein